MNSNVPQISFFEFCRNYILDNLRKYKDTKHYACDLGYDLTEKINKNRGLIETTDLSFDYLKEWLREASEYWEYEKFNFGRNYINPFDDPEGYIICMVIQGVNCMLAKCKFINDKWNDEIVLTARNINKIERQVEDLEEDESLF